MSTLKEIETALMERLETYKDAVKKALYLEGLQIMAEAAAKAPVDTGRLRATHFVEHPQKTKDTIRLGFGTEYARRQNYEHKTQRGYLTDTFNRGVKGRFDRITASAKRLYQSGGGFVSSSEPASLAAAQTAGNRFRNTRSKKRGVRKPRLKR